MRCGCGTLRGGTEKAYGMWWKSYMEAVRKYPAGLSSEKNVERFLTEEARRGVAASTQNQALNALVFFHGAVLGTPPGWKTRRHGGDARLDPRDATF